MEELDLASSTLINETGLAGSERESWDFVVADYSHVKENENIRITLCHFRTNGPDLPEFMESVNAT